MFLSESIWIREKLDGLDLPPGGRVLDIGSSTFEFKQKFQPYIEENVFKPLKNKGFRIVHADKKAGKGVDKIVDIERVVNIKEKFDLVIGTNLLEHLNDVETAADNILCLVRRGGYLLVSVPFVCPYHPDPIDTMFRPSNQELEKIFPGQKILASVTVSSPPQPPNLAEEKVSIVLLQIISPPTNKKNNSLGQQLLLIILYLKNLANRLRQ